MKYPIETCDPLPPSAPVDTSREAARAIVPAQKSMQRTVINLLYTASESGHIGLTADEIDAKVGWGSATVTPRLWELEKMGLVRKSETKRMTRSGKRARVRVLTPHGWLMAHGWATA